jgi:serine/threonine-protein kinase
MVSEGRGIFGSYRLLEQLGQGGMAQVWRARHKGSVDGFDEVVVKTLHARLAGDPLFAEMFSSEARISRLLSHPAIVRVLDHGEVHGVPYLAMERIDGCDLSAMWRALPPGTRLPIEVALAIGILMCRAVGHAHDFRDRRGRPRPIVHGDLSPSNLMIRRDGGVTLIDFGVAQMDARVARGRAHLVIGKSGYLAPELLDDGMTCPRTDVFSLGVVLHELLVGRRLFVADCDRETLRRVAELPVPPPSRANPRVSAKLDEIVLRALSREPGRRFTSANRLADALQALAAPRPATRREVAAFIQPLLAHAHAGDELTTSPIAPALPQALLASIAAHAETAEETTGTVSERPRARRTTTAAPAPRRSSRGIAARLLIVALALGATLLAPEVPDQISSSRSSAHPIDAAP